MNALKRDIIDLIAQEGPLSVERYMALALGHPRHGYYMKRDPLGVKGDFITAPEISQMFGELIGLWMAQVWLDLGSPPRLRLVECGPGRGTLMQDAMRAAKSVPGFRDALCIDLIETSPVLKAEQLRRLSGLPFPVNWHDQIEDISADRPMVIIGNEFLDALPIRQYVRQAGHWHERLVGSDADTLIFGLAGAPEEGISINAEDGSILEVAPSIQQFMGTVASKLKRTGGAALLIDYGHHKSAFGDTLQAVQNHRFVDPLAMPGDADITAHIDFEALSHGAQRHGLHVHGPVAQGPFLRDLGLSLRAEVLMQSCTTADDRAIIASAERRLTDMSLTGMGALFKVVCFTPPGQPIPPAFVTQGEMP